MSDGPAPATQALYALISTFVALAASEGAVRLADGGALPQLDCYATRPDGALGLQPGCARTLSAPGGGTWTLEIGPDGQRVFPAAAAGAPWVVCGDSQVLGMNLPAEETLVADLGARAVPVRAVGVPGYGVEDALAAVEDALAGDATLGATPALGGLPAVAPRGVVVVVDGGNDWTDAGVPAAARLHEVHGWLVPPDRVDTLAGRYFASPLTHVHLLTWAVSLAAHDWSTDPRERRWLDSPYGLEPAARIRAAGRIAQAILAFRRSQPGLEVRVVLLPVDFATSESRARQVLAPARLTEAPWQDATPWTELAGALSDVPVLDVTDALRGPDTFLDGDYHLSAAGSAKMADMLAPWLR